MKIGIIDRFEKGVNENFAIIELEDREILIIEQSLLPKNLKEGDKIELDQYNNVLKYQN